MPGILDSRQRVRRPDRHAREAADPPATAHLASGEMRQLLRFAWVEVQCCLFAALFFVGLALIRVVSLPINPADALLLWSLVVTGVLWLAGWETGREVAVIFGFHLVGLALELF